MHCAATARFLFLFLLIYAVLAVISFLFTGLSPHFFGLCLLWPIIWYGLIDWGCSFKLLRSLSCYSGLVGHELSHNGTLWPLYAYWLKPTDHWLPIEGCLLPTILRIIWHWSIHIIHVDLAMQESAVAPLTRLNSNWAAILKILPRRSLSVILAECESWKMPTHILIDGPGLSIRIMILLLVSNVSHWNSWLNFLHGNFRLCQKLFFLITLIAGFFFIDIRWLSHIWLFWKDSTGLDLQRVWIPFSVLYHLLLCI